VLPKIVIREEMKDMGVNVVGVLEGGVVDGKGAGGWVSQG